MLPRFAADYRTLFFAFFVFPGVIATALCSPQLLFWLLPAVLYCGFLAGVFCHNHNHCPTFGDPRVNRFYGIWLSMFYGYPTFAWIPTHNRNHHKFINRPGDDTATGRRSPDNTWWLASTYFFVSAYWQSPSIAAFIGSARRDNPMLFRQILSQYAAVIAAHLSVLAAAISLHGVALGLTIYALTLGLMSFFALWSMMFINFMQHVHCDAWSKYDHSRNFVSRLGNWLVFNNGYHTAHHQHAAMHWSLLAAQHQRIAERIHPQLLQRSMAWFIFRSYVLGACSDRFRTQPLGRAVEGLEPVGPETVGLETRAATLATAEG